MRNTRVACWRCRPPVIGVLPRISCLVVRGRGLTPTVSP
nr:MAG TPA: alpha amylase inhibitor [Caudoviricetes sp.]DAT24030.1 MAG TPA: alpha amylase inhibitor [Caudoviricetes sp.]